MYIFKYLKNRILQGAAWMIFLLLLSQSVNAAEVGDTKIFWVHNFQFFAYDYRTAGTLQEIGDHADFYLENAVVLSSTFNPATGYIYAGTAHGGIFRKLASETEWTAFSDGLATDASYGGFSHVNAMAVSANGTVIAGTDHGIHYYSVAEQKWKKASVSSPVSCLLIDGNDVYAGLTGYAWNNDTDVDGDVDIDMGVRVSSNDGVTWTDISRGLPVDNDRENLAVTSLASNNGVIKATTEVGVFQYDKTLQIWDIPQRVLNVSSPVAAVPIAESVEDEGAVAEFFRDYSRYITMEVGSISTEIQPFLTMQPSVDGTKDYSLWQVQLEDGILGDAGKLFINLNYNVEVVENVPVSGFYAGLNLNDFKFYDQSAVATIFHPFKETVVLLSDAASAGAYVIGGQFALVTYDDGNGNVYKWSLKVNGLKEPNKGKYGVSLSDETLIYGSEPDYYVLNDPANIGNFSAVTVDAAMNFSGVYANSDGSILYGVNGSNISFSSDGGATWTTQATGLAEEINGVVVDGDVMYVYTDYDVYYADSPLSGELENAYPHLLPNVTVPVNTVLVTDEGLYAGSDYGFFRLKDDKSAWDSQNVNMYPYITESEVAEVIDAMDNSTPADASKGIYDILDESFGTDGYPDVDKNGRLTVIMHNIHDISELWNNTSNGTEGGGDQIFGYIRSIDQSTSGRSNLKDMIYLDNNKATVADLSAQIAHKLMMLRNLKSDLDEERWITEGISFVGQKICGYPIPAVWTNIPQRTNAGDAAPLISGTPTSPWGVSPDGGSAKAELYTKVAFWMQYLYENLGGETFVKDLMENELNGVAGIEALLPESISFSDLFSNWAMANFMNDVALDNSNGLSYGYEDTLISTTIGAYFTANGSGISTKQLFPGPNWINVANLQQQNNYTTGLNSWATVFTELAYLFKPSEWTGDYHYYKFNGEDSKTFRIFLLKMPTDGVKFEIREISDLLDEKKELTFDIFAEFGSNADTTAFDYKRVIVAVTNQTPAGGSAKFVQSTDVTPPETDLYFTHNSMFNEFLSAYVYTSEPIYGDVNAAELPYAFYKYFSDTIVVAMSKFTEVKDSLNRYSATLYSGDVRINSNLDGAEFKVINNKDLSGNTGTDIESSLSLGKISRDGLMLASLDKVLQLSVDADELNPSGTVSIARQGVRAALSFNRISDLRENDLLAVYSVGPSDVEINRGFAVSADLSAYDLNGTPGVFVMENGSLRELESAFNEETSVLSFEDNSFSTYYLTRTGHPEVVSTVLPSSYSLMQNYPNPFNPTTNIRFDIADGGFVELIVYDVTGRRVSTLVNTYKEAGTYRLTWDGRDDLGNKVASGLYFYKLQVNDFHKINKMLFVK